MPWSHHSHSGQFCGHATSTLEEVVQAAISRKMTTFCLTEHIARQEVDFYPEEAKVHTQASLEKLYDDFYHEAKRLQTKYAEQIQLLIGFEGEWIRDYSGPLIQDLLKKYEVDLFVGSVHHVHTIPIDYDVAMYHQAREVAGGSDERIFEDYFDSQLEMLKTLKPPLIGHFDLIRLYSDDANRSFRTWPAVWEKIERNLKFIAEYGGVLELNTSALRKGMSEAYPQSEICIAFKEMGGCFTFSDDSHGVAQVGLNYERAWKSNVEHAGLASLCCLAPAADSSENHDSRFPKVCWKQVPVAEVQSHAFFQSSS